MSVVKIIKMVTTAIIALLLILILDISIANTATTSFQNLILFLQFIIGLVASGVIVTTYILDTFSTE